jgi:DNA (cytosine-5)-methyltransferase 1
MKHIGLFEGIGGFSLAAKLMSWETIAWCEINPFCQTVLKYYYEKANSHEDIKKTNFIQYRGLCDIVTGGFPCQPYSGAGKRKGKEDERHLWPEMLRAIREIQPSWVLGENVRGLTNWNGGMVFDEVQADLEAEGYEVLPFLLPACAVNAPHRRDRIWFIAYNNEWSRQKHELPTGRHLSEGWPNEQWDVTNTGSQPQQERSQNYIWQDRPEDRTRMDDRTERFGNIRNATNPDSVQRRERRMHQTRQQEAERHTNSRNAWDNERGAWDNFPTVSPLCGRNDGLSLGLSGITFSKWRNEGIKAMGNSIVPQIALEIFKAIEKYENQKSN